MHVDTADRKQLVALDPPHVLIGGAKTGAPLRLLLMLLLHMLPKTSVIPRPAIKQVLVACNCCTYPKPPSAHPPMCCTHAPPTCSVSIAHNKSSPLMVLRFSPWHLALALQF